MKDAKPFESADQRQRVTIGFVGRDLKFRANAKRNDFGQRSSAVCGLPDQRRGFVEAEERGVRGGHNDHFAAELTGGDGIAAADIGFIHRMISQAWASGVKTRRATSTRETNSSTESNTRATRSLSWAKNRTWRIRARAASSCGTDSTRFAGPCSSR